ncbi:MAG: elongation factor P maturation arginine rhamnosyltransferase EarP [Betaproteobacteria bacterium]|nr:elongation factor P maturation arginine rhamnosyltransferase EarP [Betaproteobacteria bacterium]
MNSWDLFCRVVDNYGDIGVCWRLARQLAVEHRMRVRLWVDDLAAFHRICPEVDPARSDQVCRGVTVGRWTDPFPAAEPADVVVEAFACTLPESYLQAMSARVVKPRWINLEYLSAEQWVEECHGLASPSPRLPLTKHFFFPGFTERTGGVLREHDLESRRRAFVRDEAERGDFWQRLGIPLPAGDEKRLSLFCYRQGRAEDLFSLWQEQAERTTCLVPEGIAGPAIGAFFGQTRAESGRVFHRGNLEVRILPFLEQDEYDRLLWACDCNFVRGEDSFLRGQWAMQPMVWQPYAQEEGVHLHKMEVFLDRYCVGLDGQAAEAVKSLWRAWCQGETVAEAWPAFRVQWGELKRHAARWAEGLVGVGDLAHKLVRFSLNRL